MSEANNEVKNSRIFTVLISVVLSMGLSAALTMVVLQRTGVWRGSAVGASTATANVTSGVASSTTSAPVVIGGNEESAVRNVVAKVRPAVVSVVAVRPSQTIDTQPQEVGGGSGFIVNPNGFVVTNRHVIDAAGLDFKVVTQDGKEYPAKIVGADPILDIGLLKIEAKNLPTVELGDSGTLEVGQTVLAIGNSLAEFQNSVTKGIVSGLGRQIFAGNGWGQEEAIEGAIQIDAAINPGNSGGPLIDLSGKVVGVNTAMSRGGQLIGFALPINSVRKIIDSAIKNGRIIHPWIGIRYQMIDNDLVKELKLPVTKGAIISRGTSPGAVAVVPDSPGDKAGLKENDIISKVNSVVIDELHSLRSEIAKYSVGDTIMLEVRRQGQILSLPIKLEEFKK